MNRKELTTALTAVKPGIGGDNENANLAFTGKHVVAYNDEVSVRHPLKLEGIEGAVPAAKLLAFASRATADEVGIEQADGELLLKCGRSRVGLAMTADIPEHLVALKVPRKGWTELPEGFLEALRFCGFSASTDMTKPVLTNIHVASSVIEASDNYRITRVKASTSLPDMLIPANSAKHLQGFEPLEFVLDSAWAHFRNIDKAVMSVRLFAGEYPDLGQYMEVKGKKIVFPQGLADALDRAGVFAVSEFDTDRQVNIAVKDEKMKVYAEGDGGWFEEGVRAKGIKDLAFSVHPGFLKEILGHSVEAVLGDNAILFTGENFRHLVSL